MKPNGAMAVEKTANSKTGPISVTMTSQESCPDSCSFKGSGCYAEYGMQAIWTKKLNKSTLTDPIELAKEEAKAIESLSGKKTLRIHIVGDCKNDRAAKIVSSAASNYSSRYGSIVFGYTHAWRNVRRTSWANVSMLASCESSTDARRAMARGYAGAIVVDQFKQDKAWMENGIRYIPCPEMTGKSSNCTTCRLCWNDKSLLANKSVIVFASHSAGSKKIKESLIQIKSNEKTQLQT